MNETKKPPLNRRSLNVLLMLFSFILLPPSGIIIHSTHELAERDTLRHFAMSVHNFSAIIFLTTCVIHLIVNRKVLLKYVSEKTTQYLHLKREVLIAVLVVFGIIGFFSMHALLVR